MELRSIRCITVTAVLIALDIVLKFLSIKVTSDLKITFAYLALAAIGMLYGPTVGFLAGVITDVIGFMINPDGGFSVLFTLVEAVGAMIYGIFLYGIKTPAAADSHAGHGAGKIAGKVVRALLYGVIGAEVLAILLCLAGNIFFAASAENSGLGKIVKVLLNEPLLYAALGVGFVYGAFFTLLISMRTGSGNVGSSLRIIFSKVTVVIVCNLILTPIAMVFSGYMTWESMMSSYPLRVIKNAVQCPVDCVILLIVMFPILAAYNKVFPEKQEKSKRKEITT